MACSMATIVFIGPQREAMGTAQSRWCGFPPRLHTPTLGMPAGQRATVRPALWCKPQLACAFPTNLEPARSGLRVCAGHRPAAPEPDDRQNRAVFDTPAWYMRRGPRPRFRRSEALSRTRWQVKDSNLRSSRDGFTVQRRQACDQRECLSPQQLPCVFPTNSRRQPTSAEANRTIPDAGTLQPWSQMRAGSAYPSEFVTAANRRMRSRGRPLCRRREVLPLRLA